MTPRQLARLERQRAWHRDRIERAGSPVERLRAACDQLMAEMTRCAADDPAEVDRATRVVLDLVDERHEAMIEKEGQAA